ncbi:MAG: hypothetical protein QM760_09190 [Nibricoccus sp.]
MKKKSLVLPVLAALALCLPASAAGDHHHEKIKTPNGGRLIASVEPHAEFLVLPDRKVQITFINDDGKPVAPEAQVVTVTAGDRSAPAKLSFTKSGNSLVSDTALPAGNDFPAVVQIKVTPDAKTVNEKFTVNLSKCSECSNAEYACTCEHGRDDHKDHKH